MNKIQVVFFMMFVLSGLNACKSTGLHSTYYLGTTSFHYDHSYNAYSVKLNGQEIGGGFGGGMNTSLVKLGAQQVTWGESNGKKIHVSKNTIYLNRQDLKGKKYLAVHIYPDDSVEITTSIHWPLADPRGIESLKKTSLDLK